MPALTDIGKRWIGYILGASVLLTCLAVSTGTGESFRVQLLLCLCGATLGWTVGILATPFDEDETTRFSTLSKGFLALGSVYLVGKLEDPIVKAISHLAATNGELMFLRIVLFTTCFCVGLLFTLVTRLYDGEDRRRERPLSRPLVQAKDRDEKVNKAKDD